MVWAASKCRHGTAAGEQNSVQLQRIARRLEPANPGCCERQRCLDLFPSGPQIIAASAHTLCSVALTFSTRLQLLVVFGLCRLCSRRYDRRCLVSTCAIGGGWSPRGLLKDWTQPRLLTEDLFEDIEPEREAGFRQPQQPAADNHETVWSTRGLAFTRTCHRVVLLGGKRTGTNLHRDPMDLWQAASAESFSLMTPTCRPSAIGPINDALSHLSTRWFSFDPSLACQAKELGMLKGIQQARKTVPHPQHHQTMSEILG